MAATRDALNHAFWNLGLRFQWDEATYAHLSKLPDLRSQLEAYLRESHPHLLGVYDVDRFAQMVEQQLASPSGSRAGIEAHHST